MINCTYVVNKKKLYIYCEIKDYCKQISKWLHIYTKSLSNNYDFYIKIYNKKTIFNINGNKKEILGTIKHTDLYPLFYNMIANIVLNNSNVLLHSVVLWYNGVGVLAIGDFESGKTTLCRKALNNDIKVLSADQSHVRYTNNKLKLIQGSSYMKIDKDHENQLMINNHEIEIKFIINIIGICDEGKIQFNLVNDKNYKIKKLFKSCTWHSDIPLFTKAMMLDIDRIKIYRFLNKIELPLYDVRGDSEKIIKKIKEELN